MKTKKPVVVREVWGDNLVAEFILIQRAAIHYTYASMDTEFPGTIFQRLNIQIDNYGLMKANVDSLNLIQVGLTLSDSEGNLPDFGSDFCYIWEFNFRDFDIETDFHNQYSIELLKKQGIDFMKNKEKGIRSGDFARLLLVSRLVCKLPSLTWVTFHGAYDFGFLIKILVRKMLPRDLWLFMRLVKYYFGTEFYDVKYMIRHCDGLYGGLERVSKSLNVDRVAGKSHQAGSDSLLTMQTFMKLKDGYFSREQLNGFKGVLANVKLVASS
ncbi:hypothetical protein F0562_028959 [Nyssa sinensis]|uniref:poly(A)-specific ribonuclease n=1 Tax=Nyssa sinensis TaxID=561372 RepID=A0A5J5B5Q8_9ASTE|nr:hypothetical protein F0562_028959 [Nyssa sinensis]